MTRPDDRHCEERSDEAIQKIQNINLLHNFSLVAKYVVMSSEVETSLDYKRFLGGTDFSASVEMTLFGFRLLPASYLAVAMTEKLKTKNYQFKIYYDTTLFKNRVP